MKRLIFILVGIFMVTLVLAYTPPEYNDINLVLDGTQTATDYNDINLVLGDVPTDSCTCAGLNTNWEIDLSDYCNITTECDLGYGNITFINNGSVLFNSTLSVYEIDFKDSVAVVEKYNLGSNFRGLIG